MPPEKVFSEGLVLHDGRKVRVLAYEDGSVRFRLDGTPYVLMEAFLQGGTGDHAILKIMPVTSGLGSDGGGYPCPHDGCSVIAKSVAGLRKHVGRFHSLEAHAKLLGVDLEALDG